MKIGLLKNAGESVGARDEIVLSSRVRLARNLAGFSFPERASRTVRAEVCKRVLEASHEVLPIQERLETAPASFRQFLFESRLISRYLLEARPEAVLCTNEEKTQSLMVNEEDHIRIQVMHTGLALREAWQEANALDDVLDAKLDYAFSPEFGFLTSCPTNVGTGMRASVMLHLPGLVLQNEWEPIVNGLAKIGLTVRGSWGEGTDAPGHIFQISNQWTLGVDENLILRNLEMIVSEIIEHEQNARRRLKSKKALFLQDVFSRAHGTLNSAVLMPTKEALERLSDIRLGIAMGVFPNIPMACVDRLLILIQPSHIQAHVGNVLDSEQRDCARACCIRDFIRGVIALRPRKKREK